MQRPPTSTGCATGVLQHELEYTGPPRHWRTDANPHQPIGVGKNATDGRIHKCKRRGGSHKAASRVHTMTAMSAPQLLHYRPYAFIGGYTTMAHMCRHSLAIPDATRLKHKPEPRNRTHSTACPGMQVSSCAAGPMAARARRETHHIYPYIPGHRCHPAEVKATTKHLITSAHKTNIVK